MMKAPTNPRRTLRPLALLAALGAGALALLPAPATAQDVAGAVFTMTNDVKQNEIVKFDRHEDGSLRPSGTVRTGGEGSDQTLPPCVADQPELETCPILESASSVVMSEDGEFVYAVNAGSNSIAVIRDSGRDLERVQTIESGGELPKSIALDDDLLYVLNGGTNTINGFEVDPQSGELKPIEEAEGSLSAGAMPGFPTQIGFDNTGEWLVVAHLVNGGFPPDEHDVIDTFRVNDDGTVEAPIANESATPLPFGFEFDSRNRLVMSEVTRLDGPGTLTTYDLDTETGELQWFLSVNTQGLAPCWVAIPGDDAHAYVANTSGSGAPLPPSLSIFDLGEFSQPIFNQVAAGDDGDVYKTDVGLSEDDEYLYVLAPSVAPGSGDTSLIRGYRVGQDGSLQEVEETRPNLAIAASGLAVR